MQVAPVLGVLLVVAASPLAAQTAYLSAAWDSHYLAEIDLVTGEFGATLPMGGGLTGLAVSPSGELFGAMAPPYVPNPDGLPWLVRVDVASAAYDYRGPLAVDTADFEYEFGLAFDALGRLWATTFEGRLYQVDSENGAVTLRAELGMPLVGLAGCGTTLYGLTRPPGTTFPVGIVRIDPDAGTAAPLGSPTSSIWTFSGAGLEFSPDGRLFAVLHNASAIPGPLDFHAEFDAVTGELIGHRVVGELGRGLAAVPPPSTCPGGSAVEIPALEPAGAGLLALLLGLAAAWWLRREGFGLSGPSPARPSRTGRERGAEGREAPLQQG